MVFESLETMRSGGESNQSWPTFTADIHSRYAMFVTHDQGVSYLSPLSWIGKLENELQSESTEGVALRLDVLVQSSKTLREHIIYRPNKSGNEELPSEPFSTCLVLHDSDLGYFLLTAAGEQPCAITFDSPDTEIISEINGSHEHAYESDLKLLAAGAPRAPYQPPSSFWSRSALPTFLETRVHGRHKHMLKEEIRLSPATLDLMTEAHRVLSRETHQLGIAAADLFRRCQRLLEEFHDQIKRTDDLTYRVERLAGEDADDYDEDDPDRPRGNAALVHRLEAARARQEELVERHNELRKKMAKSGRALSEKEEGWVQEIQKLGDSIINSSAKENKDSRNGNVPQYEEPWRRFEEVRSAVIT